MKAWQLLLIKKCEKWKILEKFKYLLVGVLPNEKPVGVVVVVEGFVDAPKIWLRDTSEMVRNEILPGANKFPVVADGAPNYNKDLD